MNKLYNKNPKLKTHVVIVLDESGSMEMIYDETLTGVNEQIQLIKNMQKENHDIKASLITFSSDVEERIFNKPVKELKKLTKSDYKPKTSTALYDAVGYAIDKVEDVIDSETSVLMIIVTDGWENASHIVNKTDVSEKIRLLNKDELWTITYLGPNSVDLSKISKDLNINISNMSQFSVDSIGTKNAWDKVSSSTACYMNLRNAGETKVDNFYDS